MWAPFTEEARRSIAIGAEEARLLNAQSVGMEHILLGIVEQSKSAAAQILLANQLDPAGARDLLGPIPQTTSSQPSEEIPFSEDAKQAIAFALMEASRMKQGHVSVETLLLGILKQNEHTPSPVISKLVPHGKRITAEIYRRLGEETAG